MVPARTWRDSCSGDSSNGKIKIEEAAVKKGTASLSLFMEAYGPWSRGRTFHSGHSVLGRRALMGKWYHEQREAWMKQVREVQMCRQIRGPTGVSSVRSGTP